MVFERFLDHKVLFGHIRMGHQAVEYWEDEANGNAGVKMQTSELQHRCGCCCGWSEEFNEKVCYSKFEFDPTGELAGQQ